VLVERLSPMVFRLAYRMLRTADAAEDACQEVFLNMHRAFDTYDATRPLKPWVSRIAYNVCLHRLRGAMVKATNVAEPLDLDQRNPHAGRSPETEAAGLEATRLLEEALTGLSAQDRALVAMRYREGLSDAEIAEAVDMPVNTVKTRIFRARAKLRQALSPSLAEATP
jgi:RNA polymerase sigma-70 factor (ECF subfamily)